MKLAFGVDDGGTPEGLRQISLRAGDFRKPLAEFDTYYSAVTIKHFQALARGGTHRGVHWDYFRPMYRRKDGTTVRAWGGVPRVRTKMTKRGKPAKRQSAVLGRKRPSGRRVKQGDAILQDTRTLLRSVTTNPQIHSISRNQARRGTRVKYAAHQNRLRPFLFYTAKDRDYLARRVQLHLLGGPNGKP